MLTKILRVFISVIGFIIGFGVVAMLQTLYEYFAKVELAVVLQSWVLPLIYGAVSLSSGIIFILLSKRIVASIERGIRKLEKGLSETPATTLWGGAIGLIVGLVIAALISVIIGLIPIAWISVPLTIIDYIIFGYLGMSTGIRRRVDLMNFVSARKGGAKMDAKNDTHALPKILDTSVIIDGRIFDIYKTGVLEGSVIVPQFVLAELQRIADSADDLKRTRGRRGLDILRRMQNELKVPVVISEKDYEDVAEVDAKLLKLAKDIGGKVVTNDYNLNKVAALQGVEIFNINELANAVKPILMAGEDLSVTIVKDGKEANQGVAYLDDGTMIVVEGARGKAEQTMEVTVTSILQTAAGRMIFAKMK
ncbi:PIN/TRAM domain-containing protein [Christensenellaceae bacterium OttesenSCG-928-K19]|nr:PIN/TRAM domain-containing protein [Christensenellaceae bacterium OttesenSCG-928-K19]